MKPVTASRQWTINQVLLGAALFMTLLTNVAFFRHLHTALGGSTGGYFHIASLTLVLLCVLLLVLALFSWRPMLKPALIVVFLVAASGAYFMDTYNIVIDQDMLVNVAATDSAEASDLFSLRLLLYVVLLGILPSVLVWKARIKARPAVRELLARTGLVGSASVVIVAMLLISSAFYTSFFREQKHLRYYANPVTAIYAAYRYGRDHLMPERQRELLVIGEDARTPVDHRHELTIMVVGETARADRFSVNGYERNTSPRLAAADVISFSQVSSCGTATAISVPCKFALAEREQFDLDEAERTQNVLDVLTTAGVNVLWLDNNSSSKGVADRVPYISYRESGANPVCDVECRDVGMLEGLQAYIDQHPGGDILVVLHQMGSHGPAYYKRYPPEFERFTPTCKSSQLSDCTREEINNSYDNTIAYTDHFLGEVIELLTANDASFETAMMYVGDHGESLGENGVYLHGMPYWMAPEEQTRVPMMFWFGSSNDDVNPDALLLLKDRPYSHDYVFHTMLSLFEVETTVYQPQLDLLYQSRQLADNAAAMGAG